MSMNYNYNIRPDMDECSSRGTCSIPPAISALQELLLVMLQQTAYYILQLERLGASNENIKFEITNTLASLVSVNEFSDLQLYEILRNVYFLLEDTRKNYIKFSKDENSQINGLKQIKGFNSETRIAQAISTGEKIQRNKYKNYSGEVRDFKEILLILLKSVCLNLIKLKDFNGFDNLVYHEVLNTLNLFNSDEIKTGIIKEKISLLAEYDHQLELKISKLLLETFGGIQETEVSHSTRSGKAILVSGNNFFDLINLLEKTKDENIDIYTHSNLLIVHALGKFRQYPNLRGHYGDLTESCILDFATFPGAILLTKNFRSNRDYFYRGRLFSTDYIVPNGVIKIENNDFTPLINTAKYAKGFSKGRVKDNTKLGYNENELKISLKSISEKLKSGEIKRLYIVGNNAHQEVQRLYFKDFFKHLSDDEFVISFSYVSKRDNVLTINTGDYMPLVSGVLKSFFDLYPVTSDNVYFMFTTCDAMTISVIVLLKKYGAKNIYMSECTPTIINPPAFQAYVQEYNINITSGARADLENIRKNKSSQ